MCERKVLFNCVECGPGPGCDGMPRILTKPLHTARLKLGSTQILLSSALLSRPFCPHCTLGFSRVMPNSKKDSKTPWLGYLHTWGFAAACSVCSGPSNNSTMFCIEKWRSRNGGEIFSLRLITRRIHMFGFLRSGIRMKCKIRKIKMTLSCRRVEYSLVQRIGTGPGTSKLATGVHLNSADDDESLLRKFLIRAKVSPSYPPRHPTEHWWHWAIVWY